MLNSNFDETEKEIRPVLDVHFQKCTSLLFSATNPPRVSPNTLLGSFHKRKKKFSGPSNKTARKIISIETNFDTELKLKFTPLASVIYITN